MNKIGDTSSIKKPLILVVDDNPINLRILDTILLKEQYETMKAFDGQKAVELATKRLPDLILLDIMMPLQDGVEVCYKLKQVPLVADVPVVFLTAKTSIKDIVLGFEAGAVDYITKPFNVAELRARVRTHINLQLNKKALIEVNKQLQAEVAVRKKSQLELIGVNKEILDTQQEMILTLAQVLDSYSQETAIHVWAVSEAAYQLAILYGLSEEEATLLRSVAPMHDIGKIGIPDAILHKPGKLTTEERAIINTHAEIGYKFFKKSKRKVLQAAATVAHEHHEHWAGTGYPRGLKKKDIHIFGRIVGVTDVFDALMNKRSYKDAWTIDDVVTYYKAQSGKQFEPKLVDLLLANLETFVAIANKHESDLF